MRNSNSGERASQITHKSTRDFREDISNQIALTRADGGQHIVSEDFIARMSEKYPNLDVTAEVNKLKDWLNGNPKRRQVPASMDQFISVWLGHASYQASSK